mmetsp:Transcript_9032/g.23006  ORF Transcript_9032/g.23006 Transcript_9032/m.23006 type:complete len:177 (+) Transcript_9032:51-581(+)
MRDKSGKKSVAKQNLPSKVCVVCNRPFTWRKKWERCWDEITTCSDSCKSKRKALMKQEKNANANANASALGGVSSEMKYQGLDGSNGALDAASSTSGRGLATVATASALAQAQFTTTTTTTSQQTSTSFKPVLVQSALLSWLAPSTPKPILRRMSPARAAVAWSGCVAAAAAFASL